MDDVKYIKVEADDRPNLSGGIDKAMRARFMVGTFGPFEVRVPKTEDWDVALKAAVDDEARRARSFAS